MLERDAVVGERYTVQRRLGAGGMGEVYLAYDEKLDRSVALKVLSGSDVGDATARGRLLREARAAARLEHPGIVQVFDVGETDDGDAFLVMERIKGRSVRDALREGPLPREESLRIIAELASALAAAHVQGVVHRDVKPDNAMLREDGRVVLLDFGLVKRLASPLTETATPNTPTLRGLTRTGAMVGTPAYLAPEQARGRAVAATDQWALAVTAYELLTGRIPWDGEDTTHVLAQIMVDTPPALSSSADNVPASADEALARALEKDPSARHPDVEAFARALLESFGLELRGSSDGTLRSSATPRSGHRRRSVETPNNLPPSPATFVGRRAELRDLAQLFRDGARLVTLRGTGGTGKTRFACHYASTKLPEYPGGVWFCDLADATSLSEIASVVGSTLGVALGAGPVSQLGRAIRERDEVLLVLDNFEQIVDFAAETVGRWTQAAPQACFLVTSREPLHLAGERTLPLDPLPLPGDSSLDELLENDAVRLFLDRAREVAPKLALTESTAKHVADVVRMVDGLPLAIELAAARMRVLSPAKLVDRLSKRFVVLRSSRRDRSSRHTTMRGAIDWSWSLCTPAEQLALAQCSVFRGGFELEAAEATLDVSALPEAMFAMDLVDSLVDKSLLRSLRADGEDEPRFGMYVSIQEYAAEKLREPGAVMAADGEVSLTGPAPQREIERRHGVWYSALGTDDAVEAFHGSDDVRRRRRLLREKLNIAAALERAIERGDSVLVPPLAHASVIPHRIHPPREVIDALERALCQVVLPAGRGSQLQRLLGLALSMRNFRSAPGRRALAEAIELAEESGDARLIARSQIDACHFSALGEDLEAALESLAVARVQAEEVGDLRYVARADLAAGGACQFLGRLPEAGAALERGLELARRLEARNVWMGCLNFLAVVRELEGRLDEALAHMGECVGLARESDDRQAEGHYSACLAEHLQQAGRGAEARSHAVGSLALLRPTGNVRSIAIAECVLAQAQLRLGELDDAAASIETAVRGLEEVDDRYALCIALGYRAIIAHERGDDAFARETLARAQALLEEANLDPGSEPGRRVADAVAIVEGRASPP